MMLSSLWLLASVSFAFAANNSTFSGSVSYDVERKKLARNFLGFSIGPVSVTEVVKSNLTSNLLSLLGDISGAPVPIRIGGASSDKTIAVRNLTEPYVLDPEARDLDTLFINKQFFDVWSGYFPEKTPFVYTLNFANTENSWGNATLAAYWAIESLGESLELFELGDSPDHYAYLAYRNASTWNSTTYADEFKNLSSAIVESPVYTNATHHPGFQAGGFADPPSLPDQQWENDDLDVVNVTKAGLEDSGLIESYAIHLFPEADSPPVRKAKISLDVLSNHDFVYQNLSQYKIEAQAAAAQDSDLVLSSAGSVAGGASGVSDTFGAALWGVDFALTAASLGISRTYFHFDGYSPDSPIVPIDYQIRAQNLTSGVRSNFYTNLFLAHVVNSSHQLDIAALPAFNTSTLSGFALFDDETETGLQKLVFVDLSVYNTTSNLWNSAAQSRNNGTAPYTVRENTSLSVSTTWKKGTQLKVVRLEGPGTNARSNVRVSGQFVDPKSGEIQGVARSETLTVGPEGMLTVQLRQAEAILLERLPAVQNGTQQSNGTAFFTADAKDEAAATTGKKSKKKKNAAMSLQIASAAVLVALASIAL